LGAQLRIFARAVWKDWLALMSGIASVGLAIVGKVTQEPLLGWLFWGAAVFCFVAAAYRVWAKEYEHSIALQKQVDEIMQARPHILVGPVFVETRSIVEKDGKVIESALFACVKFTNEPFWAGSSAVAKDVVATLSYYGNDGTKFGPDVWGEWWDERGVVMLGVAGAGSARGGASRDPRLTELKLGIPQILPVAFKSSYAGTCFGFCIDSRSSPKWRFNKLRLPQEEHEVRVTLRGENVEKKTFSFLLKNPSSGERFEIVEKVRS
jgi:hypothetical protein